MCLIVFALEAHPDYRLVVAANRDELYTRASAKAQFWDDAPNVLAGRDLEKRGTWLGLTLDGRWAAVTNYRQGYRLQSDAHSRGLLVSDFLRSGDAPRCYLERVKAQSSQYNGFNLIAGDRRDVFHYSNRSEEIVTVAPGIHGLSNHLLDTPWPKVERAKQALARCLEDKRAPFVDELLALLADAARPDDARLPDTGIGREWERVLSSIFITSQDYGTRSSTVLLITWENCITFVERSFTAGGRVETVRHEFRAEAGSY